MANYTELASFQYRCESIAKSVASVTDTHWILKRILYLAENGESGESIMRRLNPPVVKQEKYEFWAVE